MIALFLLFPLLRSFETEINNTPITITIPNYRDILCARTVHNAYIRAKYPNRIFVVVVQELFRGIDDDILLTLEGLEEISPEEKEWLDTNLTVFTKPAEKARGLHLNQFQAEMFVQRSGFFMRIDSHSDFLLHFDHWLLYAYQKIGDEKAVFSNFPLGSDKMAEFGFSAEPTPVFGSNCILRQQPPKNFFFLPVEMDMPIEKYKCLREKGFCQTLFVVGGFLFGPTEFLEKVPYDPYLEFLFFGEQMLNSMKAFTHGFNVYTIDRNIVFHYYSTGWRSRYKANHIKKEDPAVYERSVNRMRLLMGYTMSEADKANTENREIARFGNGDARSQDEFWTRIGIEKDKDYNATLSGNEKNILSYCQKLEHEFE